MAGGALGPQDVLFQEPGERMHDVRAGSEGAIWLLTGSRDGRVLLMLAVSQR